MSSARPEPTVANVLRPAARSARPFPLPFAVALGVAFLIAVPHDPSSGPSSERLNGVLRVVSALCGAGLATWLEDHLYSAFRARSTVVRVLLGLITPPVALVLGLVLASIAGVIAAGVFKDNGVVGTALGVGAVWLACSAEGSFFIIVLDSILARFVRSFRARVQAAVMGLIAGTAALAFSISAGAETIARFIRGLSSNEILPELEINVSAEFDPQMLMVLRQSDTADTAALGFFVISVLLALPALLSASSKLSEVVMERLDPLRVAFERVSKGDLEVRVEEVGATEMTALSRGFNEMAKAQEAAFSEIRRLNEGLEAAVEERTRDLQQALDSLQNAQAQLVESARQAMIGRLVAGLLHEVNNPLGALRSAADTIGRSLDKIETLVQEVARTAPELRTGDAERSVRVAKRLVSLVDESTNRVHQLMDNLGRFVHLDEAEYKVYDAREGLNTALRLIGPELNDGMELVRDICSDGPAPVLCYPSRLNRVFLNVLQNAVDAVARQGAGRIEARLRCMDNGIEATIRDSGRGMTKDQLAQAFEFGFTKTGERVTMKMGLPSAKRWLDEIDGSIHLDSEVGRGTEVRIRLPRHAGQEASKESGLPPKMGNSS